MALMVLRKYAVATHIYMPLVKRGIVDYAVGADWTPATGDVKVSIDGGTAANIGTLPTAIAMGNTAYWDFTVATGEVTGKKVIVTISDSATKAVEDDFFEIETYGNASAEYLYDPTDGVRLGMLALPNAAAEAAGGLYTRGTGAGQITQANNGQIDSNVIRVGGTTQTARDLGASVLLSTLESPVQHSGTAQAGASGSITLAAGASATNDLYKGSLVKIYGGAGSGQTRVITGYNGSTKVATIGRNWATNPDNTSTYAVLAVSVPVVDDNLAVLIQSGTGTDQLSITSGIVQANVTQISSNAASAAILDRSARGIVRGTIGAASTTTVLVTSSLDPAATAVDQFKSRVVIFDKDTTTANLRGQARDITANTALGVLTVTALTDAPVSGDTFVIV